MNNAAATKKLSLMVFPASFLFELIEPYQSSSSSVSYFERRGEPQGARPDCLTFIEAAAVVVAATLVLAA